MKEDKPYWERIVVDPGVHFGRPCVANTRIPVDAVLEVLAEDLSFREIIERYYPDLGVEEIKACLRYATDLVRSEEIHERSAS